MEIRALLMTLGPIELAQLTMKFDRRYDLRI